MANPISGFLRDQHHLRWDPSRGIVVNPRGKNTKSFLESITAIDNAINCNIPLNISVDEQGALLKAIYPWDGGLQIDDSIRRIRTFIRTRWLNVYLANTPLDQHPIIQRYLNEMVQWNYYWYRDYNHFINNVDSFLNIYSSVPVNMQETIMRLCHKFPKVFANCGTPGSHGSVLEFILEDPDPLNDQCLRLIAANTETKKRLLSRWLNVQTNLTTYSLGSNLEDIYRLMVEGLPLHWVAQALGEAFFFTDLEITTNDLVHFQKNQALFDFYYTLCTNDEYDHKFWKFVFPLEMCLPHAATYAPLPNLTPENQAKFGALQHQSVLIAEAGLKEERWGLEQLLSFFMLRRNFMAYVVGEENPEQVAVPGPYTGCSKTRCDPALSEALKNLINDRSRWGEFVEQEGESYRLKATICDLEVVHTTIHFRRGWVKLEHTKNLQMRKDIINSVEIILEEARELSGRDLMISLGLIFWWLCRSKMWFIGELHIAEGVIRSFANNKRAPLPPWKEGVSPLDEVLKSINPLLFAENFHTLFKMPT